MAFVPRSFVEILADMIAYMQVRTKVTDFNVGSIIRTTLEAAALEDDEQYFQMVQLLDLFSFTTAEGEDLDRRLADFNIFREPAKASFGKVVFSNGNLIIDQVSVDAVSGSFSLSVFDSTDFPTAPPNYIIRIGEGTTNVQEATVTGLNTVTNTFTLLAGLASAVSVGDRVALVTGSSSNTIPVGTEVQAPPTSVEGQKIYATSEAATIAPGNLFSNQVLIVSTDAGASGNVGANRVTRFLANPLFSGAGVDNPSSIKGGIPRERDEVFRERAVEKLQSLSRGTVLALKAASVGIEDPITGQRVISSNVLEDFAANPDEVIVYIDDGTGLSPDIVALAQDLVASATNSTITLNSASLFPSSGFILVDELFLIEYVSVNGNVLTLATLTPVALTGGEVVRRVNVVSSGSEDGQKRFKLQNPPVVRNTERIYTKPSSGSWSLLVSNTDYILNRGTGEFSIVDSSGLGKNTEVVAFYNYYTNLIAQTQKVLEGDFNDSVNFPGVKAAGIFLAVEAPVSKAITVLISITAETTFVESDLVPLVKQQIEFYINSLKIGQDVILSKIIDVAHNIQGVRSVIVILPTSDIVVLENELPIAFDNNGVSLVTVL